MTEMLEIFAEERALRLANKAQQMRRAVAIAAELGTRGAARRLGVSKDAITQWLQTTGIKPVEPTWLELRVERMGPVYCAVAKGAVRRCQGKQLRTVPFEVEVRSSALVDALEGVVHSAMLKAWETAGRRHGKRVE